MRLGSIKPPASMVLSALLLPGVLAAQCTTNGAIGGNRRYRRASARYQREAEEHGERLPPFAKAQGSSGQSLAETQRRGTAQWEWRSQRSSHVDHPARRSEDVGHQGGGLSGIGGIGFPKLGAHPLLLNAELEPEPKKTRTKAMNPRTWEIAIVMPKKPIRIPV